MRAFELARSGECVGLEQVKARLKAERYAGIDQEFQGLSVRRQLQALCRAANAALVA